MNNLEEKIYDFIIIGGGPAGSTFARLINQQNFDQKLNILIVEQSEEETGEKLCGGLIAPDAQRMLGKFQLSLPKDVLVNPQMFSVHSKDLRTENSQKYQRFYLNINRKKFDNWLLGLSGVEVIRGTQYINHIYPSQKHDGKRDEKHDGKPIDVNLKKREEIFSLKTRYLIAADGAKSPVRRKVFHDFNKITKYLSIQSEIESKNIPPCFEVFFDKKITDFYGWTIPKNDRNIIGIALKGDNPVEKYERFLKAALDTDYKEINRKATMIIRPKNRSDYKLSYKNRIFFIGEAAGFISPSSAEGFSYAFKSAGALARAVRKVRDGKKRENKGKQISSNYRKFCRKIKRELFFKRLKSVVMYNQILRNLIFKLGINKL